MDQLFETCGVLASFLATFIEGEILFLTSIISAKMGYFNFYTGLGAAFLGAYIKDLIKFALVKKHGLKLLAKKPNLKLKLDNASSWFDKRPFMFLSVYRLMYGFSTAVLLLSGLRDTSFPRFAFHSAISVGLWVTVVGTIGFFCAELMLEKMNFISEHKIEVIGALAGLGLLYWVFVKRPWERHCFVPIEAKY